MSVEPLEEGPMFPLAHIQLPSNFEQGQRKSLMALQPPARPAACDHEATKEARCMLAQQDTLA
jgi:hypothetical protein